jgi:hypothetical protein
MMVVTHNGVASFELATLDQNLMPAFDQLISRGGEQSDTVFLILCLFRNGDDHSWKDSTKSSARQRNFWPKGALWIG